MPGKRGLLVLDKKTRQKELTAGKIAYVLDILITHQFINNLILLS